MMRDTDQTLNFDEINYLYSKFDPNHKSQINYEDFLKGLDLLNF